MAKNQKEAAEHAAPGITNETVISGTVVSVRGNGETGTILIACPLITTVRRDGKLENQVRTNFPSLSFNRSTETKDIAKNFKRGDHVIVHGHLRSYIRQDDSGEAREILSVYIDTVEHDVSKMMSGFCREGRTYPEPRNEVYLSGSIAGVTKLSETILSVRLDLSENGRRNRVTAMYYRAPAGLAEDLAIGDRVDVLGMIQTADTTKNKPVRNYQTLVILEMAK